MMMVTGLFSLIAFPLDDFWHRLFGQDVTLWGPTHLMLIGGAVMTLLAIAVIQAEVVRAMKTAGVMHKEMAWVRHLRVVWLPGGLLVGMSTFQGEFDFGVPQFQMIFHPLLIMLAAGVTLVMTRIWLGRGALFGAIGFFIITRLLLNLIVHNSLGESLTHFPLYIVEALCVEAAALLVATRRPLAFGLTAGALIGTVGLAAEWGWSHVWMPLPWSVEILPETIALGLAMAIAASILGAWIGARLSADDLPYTQTAHIRWYAIPAAVAIFAMLAFPLFTKPTTDVRANVVLTNVQSGPQRTVMATVTLTPRDAADHANWFTATSWQGGGELIHDRLQRVSEGVYRTTRHCLCMAIGRRCSACTRAVRSSVCRSTRRRTVRSRSPPWPRRPASTATSSPTTSCCSVRPRRATRRSRMPPTAPCSRSRSACSQCSPGACTASGRPPAWSARASWEEWQDDDGSSATALDLTPDALPEWARTYGSEPDRVATGVGTYGAGTQS